MSRIELVSGSETVVLNDRRVFPREVAGERVLARNLATNPSFEEASSEVVVTPEGVMPVPTGVVNDGDAVVWQTSESVFVGDFAAAFEWRSVIPGPFPDTVFPDTSFPGQE